MASNSRRQIETWLGTLEISGEVVDIGGLFWPVEGRTKTWYVTNYKIADIKSARNGVTADKTHYLNKYFEGKPHQFDVAFCIEVTDHCWNLVTAFENMWLFLKEGGLLYISSNFIYPHHTGHDCVRLTRTGLEKLLTNAGFKVLKVTPRFSADESLPRALDLESKVQYHRGEIGYMIEARKI